jgi:DNA modification methylase
MEVNLVLDGPYQNKDFYNFISTSEQPRHQWYYFKEGFSTKLIKEAISIYPKNTKLKILDPFSGSGTTVLTSSLLGHSAVGIEVNPFLHFTSEIKTKSWNVSSKEIVNDLDNLIRNSRPGSFSKLEGFSTFTNRDGLDKWLFNTSVLRRFNNVVEIIDKEIRPESSSLFLFASLIAAMDCSNVKKDGKGVRYKKNWKDIAYSGADFERSFKELILRIIADIEVSPISPKNVAKIYLSDSRTKLGDKNFKEDDFDLVITSPPYLNSFDYTDIYRPELFLGGFVNDNAELQKLRHQTLRSHAQIDWNPKIVYHSNYLRKFRDMVSANKEQLWSKRIPLMIEAYFDDLSIVLQDIKLRMKKGGQIWLVVSTSAYAGVHIPVDLIIGELGHELGLHLKGIHCLRYLRTASQQYDKLKATKAPLRESLIILERK